MGDTASNVTLNESEGSGGEAHSREEAMLRELWDASREESPPPPVTIPLRAQRSDSSLAEKIKFLAEASWTSDVDFMDLPEQNTTDLTNEIQNFQDAECPGDSSAQVPATSGWTQHEQITPENCENIGHFPGNEPDPFAGLPREDGSTTLPPTPPLFTSAAPCAARGSGIPPKLYDFIAAHLPTDTNLSSLMTTDSFPDQGQGLAPFSMPSEAPRGVPNSSQLSGPPSLGAVTRLTAGHEPVDGCMPNNVIHDSIPINEFSLDAQDPRMNLGMQRPPELVIPSPYQMSIPGHNQSITSQMSSFSRSLSPSPCSEPVHGQAVRCESAPHGNVAMGMDESYQTHQMHSPLVQGGYGSHSQHGVWGSETGRTSVREGYSRGSAGNIEKMVQNCLKPVLGSDTNFSVNQSGGTHHQSGYGFAHEEKTWSPAPSETVGYLPSDTYTGSWSPQARGVQLEPSLVPSSQPRALQMAHSCSGPIPSTVISKSVKQFPVQHSPSPEPQIYVPYRYHQGRTAVGTNVKDRLDVLDIESSMSSGSTGTSVSTGHRVPRCRKSVEDADDGTVMCPKKVVRKNMEGEGLPVRQETSETPRKSGMSVSTVGDDAMAIDSEGPQNNIPVEDYLAILRSAKGSKKALQNLMPCRAPGLVDPSLEQAIKKCDFDLRVSRAEKKMEEHNESMRRIDAMAASGQMTREEAKSRRRQAYNRREAAASRARKDNELRDLVREKERLEKVEKHLRELIICGPPETKKKTPILRRQNSAGACGSGQSAPFNFKQFLASQPADVVHLTT